MYDKITRMYEINNLNEVITLKDALRETNMNKGEILQSYIIQISCHRDQW